MGLGEKEFLCMWLETRIQVGETMEMVGGGTGGWGKG